MSTYLTRTTGTPTNAKKWTLSFWVKISADFSTAEDVVYTGTDGSNEVLLHRYETDGTLACKEDTSAQNSVFTYTNSEIKFRDCNAWQHWVYAYDSTQSTDTNRLKVYINGVDRRTVETLTADTKPPLNHEPILNKSGYTFGFGRRSYDGSNYFKGLLSHVHFIDGVQYDASTFGSTDSTTGEWKINTSPTISDYGNNGFFILKDGNSVTDQSGKGNNFTAYGTLTKTEDCPSNVFATANPLYNSGGTVTYSAGNTRFAEAGGQWKTTFSTLGASSGKYYAEFKCNGNYMVVGVADFNVTKSGIADRNFASTTYISEQGYGYYNGNGDLYYRGSSTSYGATYGNGDIIGVALDCDNNRVFFSKNGVWQNSADPTNASTGFSMTATNATYGFGLAVQSDEIHSNFGNGYFNTTAVATNSGNGYAGAEGSSIFNYQPPTGYSALSTKGLNQ